jgi:hypothetical protein
MRLSLIAFLSVLLLVMSSVVEAADNAQTSRSAGKMRQDSATDLSQLRKLSEPLSRALVDESGNYAARTSLQRNAGVANRHDQLFDIVDTNVQLISDLDDDGFHHAINVYFDVDVNIDRATVYAKLYLSREGEPWRQYFTTDLFVIHADDSRDAYEVETELMEGYAPGYYALLVEIYSLDHAYLVASSVLDYHSLGRDVPIEDLQRDEPYAEAPEEVYVESSSDYYEEVHHGGGSVASLLMFFLIIPFVIAARGSLALFPRNDSDYKNTK